MKIVSPTTNLIHVLGTLRTVLCAVSFTILSLQCTGSPQSTSPAPVFTATLPPLVRLPRLPPIDAIESSDTLPSINPSSQPRVTVDLTDDDYPLKFPTSISEQGDLVAGMVDAQADGEEFYPTWLRIKSVKSDKTEHLIELVAWEHLGMRLNLDCLGDQLRTCIHRSELEGRAEVANAVLAKNRWRVFPCYRDLWQFGEDRLDPGCEHFRDADVRFRESNLRVALHGRVLLDKRRMAWGYQGASCRRSMHAAGSEMAFDSDTALLLVFVAFYEDGHSCTIPPLDFHPLHMPALRSKTAGPAGGTP